MSVVPLASLPSRMEGSARRASERVDPYWDSLWRTGSSGDWLSNGDAVRLRDAGLATVPGSVWREPDVAEAAVVSPRHRRQVSRLVAAVDQWRTLTVEQLEALSGVDRVDGRWLPLLWSANMFDFAYAQTAFRQARKGRLATLVRPARSTPQMRAFEESLTWPEWVRVTGGAPLDHERQYARHNVLASEFGLRMGEFGRVGTVLGEKLSTIPLIGFEGSGMEAPIDVARAGSDLTIVRPDGVRIGVEVTGNQGPYFVEKVTRLARVLHRRSVQDSGLMFLFVVAPHQSASVAEVSLVTKQVKRAVQKAVRRYPGTHQSPTAARFGVVSWRRLFPERGMTVADLPVLPVERPTGMLPGRRIDDDSDLIWEPARMLDEADVPVTLSNPEGMRAVLVNASGLLGVPQFLRDEGVERPSLVERSLGGCGLWPMPQVTGTRDFSVGRGAVGGAGVIDRLRF